MGFIRVKIKVTLVLNSLPFVPPAPWHKSLSTLKPVYWARLAAMADILYESLVFVRPCKRCYRPVMSQFLQWMTQHQGTARNRHVEALATLATLYSDTSHIFSSDARAAGELRTKIMRLSSHPPRIPIQPWQSSADIWEKLAQQNAEVHRFSGTLVPIIVGHHKRRHWENIVSQRGPQRCPEISGWEVLRPQPLHLMHPGALGGWWLLSLATTPLEPCFIWWNAKRPQISGTFT